MTEDSKTVCRHTEGPMHDCAYVDKRNSLLPEAYQWANSQVTAQDRFGNNWSRIFSEKMTELIARAYQEGKFKAKA
jgi:hypothetical protein